MPVLRPRKRLVYFRLSEDEFQRVSTLCAASGARSISDFTRLAVEEFLKDEASNGTASLNERLRGLDEILAQLNERLRELTNALSAAEATQRESRGARLEQGAIEQ